MKLPKISIITPSYNQGKFIRQTIESVLSQNYPNLEYIVMDGGSTDETISILKEYEGKIKWFSQKDKGQSDAINKGLKMATSDIVAWLNSDDYYMPGTLEKVGSYFAKHTEVQWVTGDYKIVDEQGKEIQSYVRIYKNILRALPFRPTLYIANYINQPSTFWRRKLLYEVGYINEQYHLCMDYDYWLRIYSKYPLSTLSGPLSAFRIHSTSKGKQLYAKQFEEEYDVAITNGSSRIQATLHAIHGKLINSIYSLIK